MQVLKRSRKPSTLRIFEAAAELKEREDKLKEQLEAPKSKPAAQSAKTGRCCTVI